MQGSTVKVKDYANEILQMFIEKKYSIAQIDELLKLNKKILPRPNNAPSSWHMLEKMTATNSHQVCQLLSLNPY